MATCRCRRSPRRAVSRRPQIGTADERDARRNTVALLPQAPPAGCPQPPLLWRHAGAGDRPGVRFLVALRSERLMSETLGETPSRYYLKLRLQAARNHLFYGDMPVQEIAQACGFSSPSVLSRAFKTHFGVSPREFRRQFSQDRLERFRPELRRQPGVGRGLEEA